MIEVNVMCSWFVGREVARRKNATHDDNYASSNGN